MLLLYLTSILFYVFIFFFFFFFSSRRRHTRLQGDWSSDVCSSDLDGFWQKNVHAVTFPAAGALTRRRWPPPLTWSNCSTSCGAPAVFRAVWADDCRSSDSSARMALI